MNGIYEAIAIPFGWLLGQFYHIVHNYFLAIALFALLVKIVLLPSAISQQKSTAKQTRLQSKVRRIQERYKGDKDAQRKIQEEQQALYQREGFNPMSGGCLPMLIQFPIIIGLYGAVYKPLTYCLNVPEATLTKLTELLTKIPDIGTAATGRAVEITVIDNISKIWDSALNSGSYYYLYKGSYYQVKGLKYYSSDKGKNYYCGYFTVNGVKYYLDKRDTAAPESLYDTDGIVP